MKGIPYPSVYILNLKKNKSAKYIIEKQRELNSKIALIGGLSTLGSSLDLLSLLPVSLSFWSSSLSKRGFSLSDLLSSSSLPFLVGLLSSS